MRERFYRYADERLGVITTDELRRSGASDRQIEHLVRTGRVIRMHRSVYRLAGSTRTLEQRALAATLACGPGAVASHITAAELYSFLAPSARPIDVTIRVPRDARHDGIRVHRSKRVEPRDTTAIGIVPVTSPVRTLIDIRTDPRLEEAMDEAIRRRLVTPLQLTDAPGRVRELAIARLRGSTEGRIERLAVSALKRAGLPLPRPNYWVTLDGHRYRIDLAYVRESIAIELEGEAPHWGRDRWQSDHVRRIAMQLAGWTPLAFTWWDVRDRPEAFARTIGSMLGAPR